MYACTSRLTGELGERTRVAEFAEGWQVDAKADPLRISVLLSFRAGLRTRAARIAALAPLGIFPFGVWKTATATALPPKRAFKSPLS
jgi:hypothetical protein